jgi:hypothetical protein
MSLVRNFCPVLGFTGAALLSIDAIYGKRRVLQEEGKDAAREATAAAGGDFVDARNRPIKGETGLRLWFTARSQRWNRIGFLLMAAGFLCDVFGKWKN